MNISDLLKYFNEFGFEDPEFFQSGAVIQACQEFLTEQMFYDMSIVDLVESETHCPDLSRDVYVGGMGHLIAVALSFPGPGVFAAYDWVSTTLGDDIDVINKYMDTIALKLKPHLKGELETAPPLSFLEVFSSKEFRKAYGKFHKINDQDELMRAFDNDDYPLVKLIVDHSPKCLKNYDVFYLRLARYQSTINVRLGVFGTVDLTRSDIHQKLLGLFSIQDKDKGSMFTTFYPRWEPELIQQPTVKQYLRQHGSQVIQEVLYSRLHVARNLIHDSHEDSFRDRQVPLLEQCIDLVEPTPEVCARWFYAGIKSENEGFLLDLAERKNWLKDFCLDLAGHTTEVALHEQAVKSIIRIIGVPAIVNAIATVNDDVRADELIASLYQKTNDPSLPPRLKNLTVLARVFCDDLSI